MKEVLFIILKTRIKEIRQSKGMSLRMLADLSGTSKESIINLETGRTDPKLSTLLAVADALHVPLAELFDEPQPVQQPDLPQKQYDALAWAYIMIAKEYAS